MRRALALGLALAAFATGVLIGGCGGGNHPSHSNHSTHKPRSGATSY